MRENTFWLSFWAMVIAAMLIFLAMLFHYESADFKARNEALVKMVSAGADPLAARCALKGEMGPGCGFYNLARLRATLTKAKPE